MNTRPWVYVRAVNIRMDLELDEMLRNYAKKRGMSHSEAIRYILRSYLEPESRLLRVEAMKRFREDIKKEEHDINP